AFEIDALSSMKVQGCSVSEYGWTGSWMSSADLNTAVLEGGASKPLMPRLKGFNMALGRGRQVVFAVNLFPWAEGEKGLVGQGGWVQPCNGKDMTGWKKHPKYPGFWSVDENGVLVGAGPVDYAFLATERNDFENFHLRVEAQVDSPESDGGVFFRVGFPAFPAWDEVNIC